MKRFLTKEKIFYYNISRKLVNNYDAIIIENLNMQEMSQCLNTWKKCYG